MCNFCCIFAAGNKITSMNKPTVILLTCVVMVGAAIGAAVWLSGQGKEHSEAKDSRSEETESGEMTNEHTTNSIVFFEGEMPPADPLMVGRWANNENQGWHKVYYDDDDGEGHYWGKEWDETDDVQEEDLNYHGNGWFRWRKSNDTLYEYSTMDFRDVPIAHIYLVSAYDSMNIAVRETNGRSQYRFTKE